MRVPLVVGLIGLLSSAAPLGAAQPEAPEPEPEAAEPEPEAAEPEPEEAAPEPEAAEPEAAEPEPEAAEAGPDEARPGSEGVDSDPPKDRASDAIPPVAADVDHGSGRGEGNSRGPGMGDGLGRDRGDGDERRRDAASTVESAPVASMGEAKEKTPPIDEDPLLIAIGDFTLRPRLQYRLRYYHSEGRDFSRGGVSNVFRHRARLGLEAWWQHKLGVVLAVQDVRTFGEEEEPRTDIRGDGIDFRMAYLEARPVAGLRLRLGRQLLSIVNERLIGTAAFSEQQRSFDAFRVLYELDGVMAEAGYAILNPDSPDTSMAHLAFAHVGYAIALWLAPHATAVLEADTIDETLIRGTVGAYVAGAAGSGVVVSYEAEGYYQYGREGPRRFEGWFAGGALRGTAEVMFAPFVEAHAYFMSGDPDPDDATSREIVFPHPARHKFFGEFDAFLDFPADTDARGLRDLGATIGFVPGGVKTHVAAFVFDAMAPREGSGHYGYEVDFKASYKIWKYLGADAFYGFFVPGALKDPTGRRRLEHAAFVTVNAEI